MPKMTEWGLASPKQNPKNKKWHATVTTMRYCPNCCAFLGDVLRDIGPKCMVDLRSASEAKAARWRPPEDALKGWVKENPEMAAEAQTRRVECSEVQGVEMPCPACGQRLDPHPDDAYSFDLLGGDVNVSDVQAMSMVIRKRAVTQVVVEFEGWRCPSGHRFFTSYHETVRELCPVCRGAMARFGTTILSCRSCSVNITREKFVKLGGKQLLEDEGWVFLPGR